MQLIPKSRTRSFYHKANKEWVSIIKLKTKVGKLLVAGENKSHFYADPDDIITYEEYMSEFVKK